MKLNPFKKGKSRDEGMMPGPSRPPSVPRAPPTDEVRALSSRGVAEPDIINTLRREGYSIGEIDQAMKDALRSRVAPGGPSESPPGPLEGPRARPAPPFEPEPLPPPEPFPPGPPSREPIRREPFPPSPLGEFTGVPRGEDFFEKETPPLQTPDLLEDEVSFPQRRRNPKGGMDRREMEELTEVVVEEKMRRLDERFTSIQSQFHQMDNKLNTLADEVNRIKNEKSGESKGIEEKIDGYKINMNELGGRLESMERALKDSLSPMLESLRSLSETVKVLKKDQ